MASNYRSQVSGRSKQCSPSSSLLCSEYCIIYRLKSATWKCSVYLDSVWNKTLFVNDNWFIILMYVFMRAGNRSRRWRLSSARSATWWRKTKVLTQLPSRSVNMWFTYLFTSDSLLITCCFVNSLGVGYQRQHWGCGGRQLWGVCSVTEKHQSPKFNQSQN